jgi:hypothetical protein
MLPRINPGAPNSGTRPKWVPHDPSFADTTTVRYALPVNRTAATCWIALALAGLSPSGGATSPVSLRALKVLEGGPNLSEGQATWGAGRYWEAWQKATLPDSAQSFKRDGTYLPLSEYLRTEVTKKSSTGENCLRDRDVRYSSWAAFIDFLIKQYGMERFPQLLGPAGPGLQSSSVVFRKVKPQKKP